MDGDEAPITRDGWRALPKAELHLHLRGAMPPAVFAELLNRHVGEPPRQRMDAGRLARFEAAPNIRPFLEPRHWTAAEVAALFDYDTFDQFLLTFGFTGHFVRTPEDLRLLADGVLAGLRAEGVVYAEITVSALEYLRQGIRLADLAATLDEAAAAVAPGLRVQWIVDLVRDFGLASGLTLLEQLVAARWSSLVGITLGGSEHRFPPAQFAPLYARARAHGLRLTVHAGEALGPASVWDALRVLGVERLGHGVRSIEDPALVAHLAERGIPLEVCPTSNLRTGLYPSYADHPARALHAAGIPITVNTDDPTFFGTTLADEYAHLQAAGLTTADLLAIVKNGFRHAFLPPAEIARYLDGVGSGQWAVSSGLDGPGGPGGRRE